MIRRRTVPTLVLAAAAPGLLVAPTAAEAQQEPDPNVPVQNRPRPEFDPLGIRAGGFLIFPRLTVAETYDSNVFAEPDEEEDDLITVIEPVVEVRSNFPRHELGFEAGAEIGFFAEETDENYQNYFVSTGGTLDVTRNAALSADIGYARDHESRESPESPDAAEEPTPIDEYNAQLSFRQVFNRLNYRLLGAAGFSDFQDVDAIAGGEINQDDRDRFEYDARLRVGYLVSPRFNLFTEGLYTLTDYQVQEDDAGFDRDSQGFGVNAGVEVDLTAILFGEVFGGYRFETFDDNAFDDVSGFWFGAGLTWNVTDLTTIELVGERDVEATTQAGAGGDLATDIRLEVTHELLRNLLLNGFAGYSRDEFEGIDRTDNTYLAGAGAEYLVNRYLSVELGYRFSDRDSDVDDEEFTRHIVSLGLTGRL